MKIILGKFLRSLTIPTVVALAANFFLPLPILARDQQQVINGLSYPTSAERFFKEGRIKFDREIEILLQKRLTAAENILKAINERRIQEELLTEEMGRRSPSDNKKNAPHLK